MIYVSKQQLRDVEYLLEQSLRGHHPLFAPQLLREAFENPRDPGPDDEQAYEVEHHLERLLEMGSIEERRAYVEYLDRGTRRRVVRTYFRLLEENLPDEHREPRH